MNVIRVRLAVEEIVSSVFIDVQADMADGSAE